MSSYRGTERGVDPAMVGPRGSTHDAIAATEVTVAERQGNEMRDPVRWGAVWAGALTTLALFVLLEVTFFAFGWLTPGEGAADDTAAGWVSLILGIFAFAVGGMVAAARSIWHHVREGVVHGMLVWALATAAVLTIALVGGGAVFGASSDLFGQMEFLQVQDAQASAQAVEAAEDAAGWAAFALFTTLGAAVAGGALGVKTGSNSKRQGSHAS